MLLTRTPLGAGLLPRPVRLACIRHAAGVYPEPGSNSQSRFDPGRHMPTSEVIFRLCVGISVRMLQNSRGMTNSMFVLAGLPVQFSKSDRMLLFLRSEEKYIITKIGSQQFFSLFFFFPKCPNSSK